MKIHGIFNGQDFSYIGGATDPAHAREVYLTNYPEERDFNLMDVLEIEDPDCYLNNLLDERIAQGVELPGLLVTTKKTGGDPDGVGS